MSLDFYADLKREITSVWKWSETREFYILNTLYKTPKPEISMIVWRTLYNTEIWNP